MTDPLSHYPSAQPQSASRQKDVFRLGQVRNDLLAWHRRTQDIHLRRVEDDTPRQLVTLTIPQILQCLEGTLSVAQLILDCTEQLGELSYEEPAPSPPAFELQLESMMKSSQTSFIQAGDTAYMVKMELSQCRRRLIRLEHSEDRWEILTDADSVLRRTQKSLSALDLTLSQAAQLEPALPFLSELESSLGTRRYYSKLRIRMSQLAASTTTTTVQALRGCGTLIAMLVGDDIYGQLRMGDRRQIKELQARILWWLGEGNQDPSAGAELRQDIATFVFMLRQINQRQELIEHDTTLLGELIDTIHAHENHLPEALRKKLPELAGLDEELDELLRSTQEVSMSRWLQVLERLHTDVAGRSSRRRFI